MAKCWEPLEGNLFLLLKSFWWKPNRGLREAMRQPVQPPHSSLPTPHHHMHIVQLRSATPCSVPRQTATCCQAQTVWSGELILHSGPDRPWCVMLTALTLRRQWVGTSAWAHDYKRFGGVRCMPPVCPITVFGPTASAKRVCGYVCMSALKWGGQTLHFSSVITYSWFPASEL